MAGEPAYSAAILLMQSPAPNHEDQCDLLHLPISSLFPPQHRGLRQRGHGDAVLVDLQKPRHATCPLLEAQPRVPVCRVAGWDRGCLPQEEW